MLTALKGDAALADIPVIMLTIVEEREMGYALGAADYLTKPIERDRLISVLRKYGGAGQRVLVVDDDQATRETLRRPMEAEGWLVDEAGDGQAALDRVAASRPALIILDLLMPEMDGFEFLGELRQRTEWRSIPVVVLTARDLSAQDRDRLNGRVDAVLQKASYTPNDLLAELRDRLARVEKRAVLAR